MNKEDIIINNKLIFDFMGKEYAHWTFENRTSWISARKNLKKNVYWSFDGYKDLKYHTSWSWLMSVLDKIEKLGFCTEIAAYHANEKLHWCAISVITNAELNDMHTIIPAIESDYKIECVYNACIKFIEWYNCQTSKK